MASLQYLTITVDVLNQEPWLDAMQRAIDLAEQAERACEAFNRGACPNFALLEEAAANFRAFFEGDDEE